MLTASIISLKTRVNLRQKETRGNTKKITRIHEKHYDLRNRTKHVEIPKSFLQEEEEEMACLHAYYLDFRCYTVIRYPRAPRVNIWILETVKW